MPPFRPKHLAVISLRAEDVPRTVHFYRDVLGLALLPHHDHRPAFDLNGLYLVIVEGTPAPAQDSKSSRFPSLAFAVEDLDEAIDHLQAHDVDIPWGIEAGQEGRWVMFYDPAGNLIELVQFGVDKSQV